MANSILHHYEIQVVSLITRINDFPEPLKSHLSEINKKQNSWAVSVETLHLLKVIVYRFYHGKTP